MPMDNAQRQQIMEQVNMQVEMAKLKQLLEVFLILLHQVQH